MDGLRSIQLHVKGAVTAEELILTEMLDTATLETEMAKKLYTVAEAAEKLGMTKGGVCRRIKMGTIKATRFGERTLMVDLTGVKPNPVGRPVSNAKRCPCGANTLATAKRRAFNCCKHAGVMPFERGEKKPAKKPRKKKAS